MFRDDQEVHLTPTEYKLLAALVRHAGKLLSHRRLLQEATSPRLLLTEPGVGYRFKAD